jgi:hypothetical protein
MIVRTGISLALALSLAGCFRDAGSLPTPAAPSGGVALVVTNVGAPTAESTPEPLPFDNATPEVLPTSEALPFDEITPEVVPTSEVLPFDDVTAEVTVDITAELLPTVEELPLFPSETPTATFVVFPTATEAVVALPATETPVLFPSETPTATFVVFPTATEAVAALPPTATFVVFPTATEAVAALPPTATFVVFPTATQDAGVPPATVEGQGGGETSGGLPTSTPIGSESDLIAIVLATATRVTSLYSQSVAIAQPTIPPIIAQLVFPTPAPPALPQGCPAPSRVSISQAIGGAPFTVQVQVLDANPDFAYTWGYRVDTSATLLVSAAGSSATFTINEPGTYELVLQARFAPGKEIGGTEACLRTWLVTQKLVVLARAR